MKRKSKTVRLLVNFFNAEAYAAYDVEIARLLKSGNFVFRRPYCKNDLFRWLTDPRHSNLEEKFQTVKSHVNETLRSDF
ncbi:MAG: hypothetical protein IJ540_01590 [Prevotella sp.]|nr:hypothetical protein [Prevotella sp.]